MKSNQLAGPLPDVWLVAFLTTSLVLNVPSATAQSRLIDSLKTHLRTAPSDVGRFNAYYDIANAFYKQGRSDSVEVYLKQAQRVGRQVSFRQGLGDCNRLMGVVRMHQGRYEESLAFYQAAITDYTKAETPKGAAMTYNSMGWLYKMMGQSQRVLSLTRQGLDHVRQAIAINQRMNNLSLLADNYVNLGIIYEDMAEFDPHGNPEYYQLGRDCFLKAIAINDQIGAQPEAYRIPYNNLGKNYHVTGQPRLAIGYLQKSMAINLSLNRLSSLAHNYRNLASAYRGLRQPDSAVYYAEKALAAVKAAKNSPLTGPVYGEMARSYAAVGRYEQAYAAAVETKRVEDSLLNLDKTRAIEQLRGQYAVQQASEIATIRASAELTKTQAIARIQAQTAREIAHVQAEERGRLAEIKATAELEKAELATKYNTRQRVAKIASLGQLTLQRARQIQYMTVCVGLLLVLLAALVTQFFLIRRANRRLSVQNEIITQNSQQLAGQSDQLRTLMKELHHRVKNNLAIVSGLLNLQMNGLHDEKARQAVRVGQQRVEAMSLIHQQLYQTDHLTVVNMPEYLSELVQSLMNAYGYQADGLRLQFEVDQQELDVDVAIPIGLIINELVSNAFKHAYSQQPDPLLRIGLYQDKDPLQTGITLEVQDNGPGVEAADWHRAIPGRQSFGKRLIASLSEQLDGQFELRNEGGTLFQLYIPRPWSMVVRPA